MKTKNIFKFFITSFLGIMIFVCVVPRVHADNSNLGIDYTEYQNNYVYKRLYNPKTGEHYYETSQGLINKKLKQGYKLEKGSLLTNKNLVDNNQSIHILSLYNSRTQSMMYTTNSYEYNFLMSLNPKNIKVEPIWYMSSGLYGVPANQGIPVYRLYNPNSWRGTHHFTPIQAEKDMLVRLGWRYEGIGFYVSGVLNE
ncbi:hypothetical protein [uncultured Enterococcus sp.]|uniref:hypothetical protein n=1 Tax=uncultured Enterococcus sp. TaxID=167972 RepID=UPI002604C6C0|nr:hypothetical protein [uncultured Enterococcus sp.]